MDQYHIWCNLNDSRDDLTFADAVDAWLGHLQRQGAVEGWRLTRRKLGLGPAVLGEFHLVIEVRDLAQLEQAFGLAATRAEPHEPLHAAVYRLVRDASFGLERDFPDAVRER